VTDEYLKSDKKWVIFRRRCKEEEIEEIVAQKSKDEKKTEDEENFGREHILILYDKSQDNDIANTIYKIPHVPRVKDIYNSSSFLGIHKLGSVAMLAERPINDPAAQLLREITGVLVSLTREDIGTIIMREDRSSDFGKSVNDLDTLVEDAGKMRRLDKKDDKSEDLGEWGFFSERNR
jgi:hypothetical protein